jgi:hypothetical protein
MARFDLKAADRLAVSVRWQSVELARATVGAVAVDEFTSLDRPFGVGHRHLPSNPRPAKLAAEICRDGNRTAP